MIHGVTRTGAGLAPAAGPEELRLRRVAEQMEGVFVEQLFKAMRETVPEGGIFGGGAGEEMFSGLMDQHVAEQVPTQWESGLAAAVYRQLRSLEEGAQQVATGSRVEEGAR